MKGTAFAFLTLIVGAFANPMLQIASGANQERLVTDQILNIIEELKQSIKDAGLDPFYFEGTFNYKLPVPVILALNAFVDGFSFTGLSDISVNQMDFAILAARLSFDISLPRLQVVIGDAGFDLTIFGQELDGSASGSVAIVEPRVSGYVRINISIIGGITVRSLSLNFRLGGIESDLKINILGFDPSEIVNTFLGTTIPDTLTEFSAEINELLEAIAWQLIEDLL